MPKFFTATCEPVKVYSEKQKQVIQTLDTHGFCISFGGPAVSGKWVGEATWFLTDQSRCAVVNQEDGYQGGFNMIASREEDIGYFAELLGLIISEIKESGPRPSWDCQEVPA